MGASARSPWVTNGSRMGRLGNSGRLALASPPRIEDCRLPACGSMGQARGTISGRESSLSKHLLRHFAISPYWVSPSLPRCRGSAGTRWLDDGVVGRGSNGEGLLGEAMQEQPATPRKKSEKWKATTSRKRLEVFVKWMSDPDHQEWYESRKSIYRGTEGDLDY